MTRARVAIGLALAIAAVIAWLRLRGHDPAAVARDPGAPAAPPVSAVASGAPAAAPHFRRFADALDRARTIDAIGTARATRERAAGGGSAGSSKLPALAEPHALTSEEVVAGIMDVLPLMEECYRDAIPRLASPRGRLHVKMSLSGEPDVGTVIDDAALTSDDPLIKDEELTRCMHETLMSVELPPIAEGGQVGFAVDLELSPDEQPASADAGPVITRARCARRRAA